MKVLTEETFEHDTQAATGATTGDWFVMFSDDSCDHCQRAQPAWEQLALARDVHHTSIAVVKCSSSDSSWVCKRFEVRSYPTFFLLRRGKMYSYDGKRDKDSLLKFLLTSTSDLSASAQAPPAEWGILDKVVASVDDVRKADPLIFYITAGLSVITVLLFAFLMCLPTPAQPVRRRQPRKDASGAPRPSVLPPSSDETKKQL